MESLNKDTDKTKLDYEPEADIPERGMRRWHEINFA